MLMTISASSALMPSHVDSDFAQSMLYERHKRLESLAHNKLTTCISCRDRVEGHLHCRHAGFNTSCQ